MGHTSCGIPPYALSSVSLVVFFIFYSFNNIGAPAQIRTERTSPFERDDFTRFVHGGNLVHPVGIEPTSTALQAAAITISAKGAYSWYLVTGSNRRHPTCKEGATTAELTRQIYFGVTNGS